MCPAGRNADFAAGHTGPALQGHIPEPRREACPQAAVCRGWFCLPCGGVRALRPTGRCGELRVWDGVSTSRQRGGAALQGPLWEGAVGAADWGREIPIRGSPSVSASRCHLPRRGRQGETDSHASDIGHWLGMTEEGRCGHRPLRNGLVGRDPCVPPRIACRFWRGTRAPPYRVRRSHRADRVVRPYDV